MWPRRDRPKSPAPEDGGGQPNGWRVPSLRHDHRLLTWPSSGSTLRPRSWPTTVAVGRATMGRIPVAEPRVGAARAAVLILAAALTFAGCAASVPATPALTPATPVLTPATQTLAPATPPPMPTPVLTPVAVTGSNGPAGFVPKAIAFADTEHGWVAGTTGGDAAFVLETTDGGRTGQPARWVRGSRQRSPARQTGRGSRCRARTTNRPALRRSSTALRAEPGNRRRR